MRSRILTFVLIVGTMALLMHAACGGTSGAGPTVPATMPVSIEEIDGTSDEVAVDSSFKYTFAKAVDESTVTEETFFMHPVVESSESISPKATYSSSTCDVSQAIDSTVSCSSSTECVLAPASDLTAAALYVICLVPGSTEAGINSLNGLSLKATGEQEGIFYLDGAAMAGDMIQVVTTGYNAANEVACDTSSDCVSTHYCFYGTCHSKTELGMTYADCTSAADCASGESCLDNMDARTCDSTICLNEATFVSIEGFILTEDECGDPDTTGYYWHPDNEQCMPADVVICETGDGEGGGDGEDDPVELSIGGVFDLDVDRDSDPDQVLMAVVGDDDSLFFYYGTYEDAQQGVISWDHDGREELDLSDEGICTDCLDIESVKVDYIGSDSWIVMFTLAVSEVTTAKKIYVTHVRYTGGVLAESTPILVNDDVVDGAQTVRFAAMDQYEDESISVFAFLAHGGANEDKVFYDECDYSGAEVVCGNDQQIATMNGFSEEGDGVAIAVLNTSVFVAFSDAYDVEVIEGDLTADPATFLDPKEPVFDNSDGGTHSLAMTVDENGSRERVDIIALSHYNVGGGPYQLRHSGGTLAGGYADFDTNVTVLNANVAGPAGFVDAYQDVDHVGVIYSEEDGNGNLVIMDHWMRWTANNGTPNAHDGGQVRSQSGFDLTNGKLFMADSEWFLFVLSGDNNSIAYINARNAPLETMPLFGGWPATGATSFPGLAE